MLALDAAQLALVQGRVAGVVWLVELDFVGTTYRFTSFNVDQTVGGNLYRAAGDLLTVSEVKESQDTDTQTLSVSLSVANAALLALALGNVESYRGRQARLYLLLLDEQFRSVGTPRLRFSGEMEPVKISRDKAGEDGGPVGGAIELPIARAGLSRARNADGLRLTDEQQRAEFAGDLGCEYIRPLIEQPSTWLSKRFQEQQ